MNTGDIVGIIAWALIILGGVWVYRRVNEATGSSRRKSMYRGNDHDGASSSRAGRGGGGSGDGSCGGGDGCGGGDHGCGGGD